MSNSCNSEFCICNECELKKTAVKYIKLYIAKKDIANKIAVIKTELENLTETATIITNSMDPIKKDLLQKAVTAEINSVRLGDMLLIVIDNKIYIKLSNNNNN